MVVVVLEVDIGMMLVDIGWDRQFRPLERIVSSVETSRLTPGDRKFHALRLLVSLFETFFVAAKLPVEVLVNPPGYFATVSQCTYYETCTIGGISRHEYILCKCLAVPV